MKTSLSINSKIYINANHVYRLTTKFTLMKIQFIAQQ